MENSLSESSIDPEYPVRRNTLLAKLLLRYQSSMETEHEQATLRLLFTIAGIFYIWLIAHSDLIGHDDERGAAANLWKQWWWPSMYILYAFVHIPTLIAHPARVFLRRAAMLFLDNIAITVLVSHGGLFNPFAAFYFWIAIGYGFRYGPNWLLFSAGLSVACFVLLLYLFPAWNAGSIFGFTMILSLCTVSAHAYYLLQRLRLAQQSLLAKASELEKLATRDNLTGLANRALLMDRLMQAITLAARTENDVAVLFIDVDGLKKVNDHIGHAAGDTLLIEIAERLQSRLRAVDTCARIAGDEFVIVLEGVTDRTSVLRVADIMLEEVRGLTTIAGQAIEMSVSIGIAWLSLLPENSRSPKSLLAVADGAMYKAKKGGGNRYCIAESLAP